MHKTEDGYLDAGMRGWIFRTAVENVYKIAGYRVEDLVQDGYMCFYKCRNRYVGVRGLRKRDGTPCRYLPKRPDKEARKHFQALVKTAFGNHISTLATRHPASSERLMVDMVHPLQTEEQVWDTLMPPEQEVASVSALLEAAPGEIKRLFALLVDDALEFAGYRRRVGELEDSGRYRLKWRRETNNEYFCRLLKLPSNYDIVGQVENYFLRS